MKLLGTAQTLSMLFLAAILAASPLTFADDLGSPPPPEPGASADWTEVNQVLEIPQQCDKDAVAMLCDRGESPAAQGDALSAMDPDAQSQASATGQGAQDPAADPGTYGSIEDYENQYATAEAGSGALYVPVPVYVPIRPMYLMPAPVIVNRAPAPGPHYLRPLPFGHRFSGGGHFRGR